MKQEITLAGMRFHALVGILAHERANAQPIEVNLTVTLGCGDGVIDYRALYDLTAAVMHSGHIEYLEEIGERVARGALAHSKRIRSARVAVRKPHVGLGGPLDFVEVCIEVTADD